MNMYVKFTVTSILFSFFNIEVFVLRFTASIIYIYYYRHFCFTFYRQYSSSQFLFLPCTYLKSPPGFVSVV